ncbi:hypothetical protein ACFQHZ_09720 [Marivibrio halodurans]|nr:hypothetical protein [Marivibrio halodurans]
MIIEKNAENARQGEPRGRGHLRWMLAISLALVIAGLVIVGIAVG